MVSLFGVGLPPRGPSPLSRAWVTGFDCDKRTGARLFHSTQREMIRNGQFSDKFLNETMDVPVCQIQMPGVML